MRSVELCACPTIGAFVERQVTYYCSTCGKAVPDPDDPTRPAVAGRFDAPKAEAKVLRVARVEQEGGVPVDPLASVREALSARCPSTDGPHVFGPLGTNGWQCGCGLTLNEATLRALEAKPGPPKAAPLGGPAAFYAAVRAVCGGVER